MNANGQGRTMENKVEDDTVTGLPLLRSWRDVYLFVAVIFCVWVIGLVLLPFIFS